MILPFFINAQIGLKSMSNESGTYLQLSSGGLFSSDLNAGTNFINTADGLSGPNVLRLQNDGLGNVTIGVTDVIGTNNNDPMLTVRASNDNLMDVRLEGNGRIATQGSMNFYLDDNNNAFESFNVIESSGGFSLMKISEDLNHFILGNVSIGSTTQAAGYHLSVDGKAIAEEVRVELSQDWPDYVFEKSYEMTPLPKLEKEIQELGHLPGIPSAKVVEAEGFDLGHMNCLLLEKIEELTLHMIELNKEIEALKIKIPNHENPK